MSLSLFKRDDLSSDLKRQDFSQFDLEVDNITVPVRVYEESRNNSRISITQKGIIIRIPKGVNQEVKRVQMANLLSWARNRIQDRPKIITKNDSKSYKSGDILNIMDVGFTIEILEKNTKMAEAGIRRNEIKYTFPLGSKWASQQKYIRKTLPKIICLEFRDEIEQKLQEMNQMHFQRVIKDVRMRNNKTSWGWCSKEGVINISPRLLLCPMWIIDYVLMHELAHLVHQDHSKKFWSLLESKFPLTKKARLWLKSHGHEIDF